MTSKVGHVKPSLLVATAWYLIQKTSNFTLYSKESA